jgi:2-polyprenyl-3-methyl-5-hydroxy-6-metoxy-1,4-benzoquinol methylase
MEIKGSPFFKKPELLPIHSTEPGVAISDPEVFGNFMVGYRATKALMVSASLDLFTHLGLSDGTVDDLSRRTKSSKWHIEILLDALVAIGVIEKRGSIYSNSTLSLEWLHPDGHHSLSNNYCYQENLSSSYARLSETIRSGAPQQSLGDLIKQNPKFLDSYMRGMEEISGEIAGHFDEIIGPRNIRSILDVGAGHGLFSVSLMEKYPNSATTMVDFPESLNYARRNAKGFIDTGRVHFIEGDYRSVDFGSEEYDVALLSHVIHDENPEENVRLLEKIFKALSVNGRLYLHDFMTSKNGDPSVFCSLFSLHLATYTESGRVYPETELIKWLGEVGFIFEADWKVPSQLHSGTKILVAKKGT